MPTFPFKRPPSSRPSSVVEASDSPAKWPANGDSKEQAVARLLEHGVISHTVGRGMEYKVRTTLVTQRDWQYRCDVFHHGKPMKWAFSPIVVDRASQMRHGGSAPESVEALVLNLAEEAIGVHFTRCAVLREYLTLAEVNTQLAPRSRRRYTRWVILVGLAFLTAYGVWSQTLRSRGGPPPVSSPMAAQQTSQPVPAPISPPAPEPAPLPTPAPEPSPLPTADQKSRPDTPAAPEATPEATPAVKVPKHVLLSALLAQDSAAEKPVPASPAEAATGKTGVDVQTGDLVRFTGWLRWISRTPNGTYQLYVTPSPRSNAPGLIATVPPPDQPAGSPATEKQLQAVRSFITHRLLRQQKPSLRRSVMRKPIFTELKGLWSSPDRSLAEPAGGGGKRAEEPTAGWGIQPLLDVQFVTPPASSSRSRSQ